jgi:hypothetical protein
MKYRNDQKWNTEMQNPFLASRRAVFAEQRDIDQGVIPAPSSDSMQLDIEENGMQNDALSSGDYAMDVDNADEIDSNSLNHLYDGDLSWITPELLQSTAPPKDNTETAKPKKQSTTKATRVAERRLTNWEELLPSLEEPYSQYKSQSLGKPNAIDRPDVVYGGCKEMCKSSISKAVTCLFMEGE